MHFLGKFNTRAQSTSTAQILIFRFVFSFLGFLILDLCCISISSFLVRFFLLLCCAQLILYFYHNNNNHLGYCSCSFVYLYRQIPLVVNVFTMACTYARKQLKFHWTVFCMGGFFENGVKGNVVFWINSNTIVLHPSGRNVQESAGLLALPQPLRSVGSRSCTSTDVCTLQNTTL